MQLQSLSASSSHGPVKKQPTPLQSMSGVAHWVPSGFPTQLTQSVSAMLEALHVQNVLPSKSSTKSSSCAWLGAGKQSTRAASSAVADSDVIERLELKERSRRARATPPAAPSTGMMRGARQRAV